MPNVTRKIVGVITLIGFSLFIGCEDVSHETEPLHFELENLKLLFVQLEMDLPHCSYHLLTNKEQLLKKTRIDFSWVSGELNFYLSYSPILNPFHSKDIAFEFNLLIFPRKLLGEFQN